MPSCRVYSAAQGPCGVHANMGRQCWSMHRWTALMLHVSTQLERAVVLLCQHLVQRQQRTAWGLLHKWPPAKLWQGVNALSCSRWIAAERAGLCCRCGMNPSSLFDMKHSIVRAVSDYVDIEAEELVEVRA